jgi:hypothetical protein
MTPIQKIIDGYQIKNIEDFDDMEYEYKLLVVNDLRECFHASGEIDVDWDILASAAAGVVRNQLVLSGVDYQEYLDKLFVQEYRDIIEENIYVPEQGEEEETALANRADDLYNEQSEWCVG